MDKIKNELMVKIIQDYRWSLADHRDEFVDKIVEQVEGGEITKEDLLEAEQDLVKWEKDIWEFGKLKGNYNDAFIYNYVALAMNDILDRLGGDDS
jgi:benzoyl-CoA reductase/2-hydroxyglutaryl-CoA dehydratase subunit BcrC/BadD/HgdB